MDRRESEWKANGKGIENDPYPFRSPNPLPGLGIAPTASSRRRREKAKRWDDPNRSSFFPIVIMISIYYYFASDRVAIILIAVGCLCRGNSSIGRVDGTDSRNFVGSLATKRERERAKFDPVSDIQNRRPQNYDLLHYFTVYSRSAYVRQWNR